MKQPFPLRCGRVFIEQLGNSVDDAMILTREESML